MDNLGEVGQKMRCAVKAKLVELGTAGVSGYIDDELPDYIMVMIANKRTKQQMISDLNLFLGDQTDIFVTWLHEVLQKLQEVTLPSKAVQKNKRKATENEDSSAKKDKKEKKKDKKNKKQTESSAADGKSIISDVVADQLLEKAKTVLNTNIKTKKEETEIDNTSNNKNQDFDIPTITEINSSANPGINSDIDKSSRNKDLAELAEIQKKIYKAKRQLKKIQSHDTDDEDFLNIREDTEAFEDFVNKPDPKSRPKSPIVFDRQDVENNGSNKFTKPSNVRSTTPPIHDKRKSPVKVDSQKNVRNGNRDNNIIQKKSVHERLGLQIQKRRTSISPESNSYKRKEVTRTHSYQEKLHLTERKLPNKKIELNEGKKRIVSRVIVATSKTITTSDSEEDVAKQISSIVTIKPRPKMSPRTQAPKNLLLKAIDEAQKSTVAASKRNSISEINSKKEGLANRLGKPKVQKELYSQSFLNRRNKINNDTKDNIVIELNAEKTNDFYQDESDEYIPEPILSDSDTNYVYYVPKLLNEIEDEEDNDNDDEMTGLNSFAIENDVDSNRKTQFVVTLNEKSGDKYISKDNKNYSTMKENRKLRINIKSTETINNKVDNNDTKFSSSYYKKPKEIKKIIIQNNDSDDDDLNQSLNKDNHSNSKSSKSIENSVNEPKKDTEIRKKDTEIRKKDTEIHKKDTEIRKKDTEIRKKDTEIRKKDTEIRKKKSVSPIKFDINKDLSSEDKTKENKVFTKKSDTDNKYDKIPDLLSSVPINKSAIKSKPKDRCKYFPSCTNSDCEYFHPSAQCKAFPNCKFADNCLYIHPKCKFDSTCIRNNCNFSHSPIIPSAAPPLASHVVPVQNYKSISATPLPSLCKYYPNCTNTVCNFYHPKPCRFGKNCNNKIECNFYHNDLPQMKDNKFKWVNGLA